MMELVDFHPDHLDHLDPLERNGRDKFRGMGDTLKAHASFTLVHEGHPVACGGLIPVFSHRLVAWSAITEDMPVIPAVRLARDYLDKQTATRIETVVDCEDLRSQKWVEALGFERETGQLAEYNHDRSCAYMYARIRNGD